MWTLRMPALSDCAEQVRWKNLIKSINYHNKHFASAYISTYLLAYPFQHHKPRPYHISIRMYQKKRRRRCCSRPSSPDDDDDNAVDDGRHIHVCVFSAHDRNNTAFKSPMRTPFKIRPIAQSNQVCGSFGLLALAFAALLVFGCVHAIVFMCTRWVPHRWGLPPSYRLWTCMCLTLAPHS